MEEHILKLKKKYDKIEENEQRFEEYLTEDAEILTIGFGITSRILRSVVDEGRKEGLKLGLFRPITLFPFPKKRLKELSKKVKKIITVELNTGQMVEDVRNIVEFKLPVKFYGRSGGVIPSVKEILNQIENF